MTQQLEHHTPPPPDVRFGDVPTMVLSHDLAGATLRELWESSPERFGNLVKKAMIRLWGPGMSSNGHRP
jgi:hypothetical protein